MKPSISNLTPALRLHKPAPSSEPLASGGESVPLDEFLQVEVISRQTIRSTVRGFLSDHCSHRKGLSYIAGRGKLIAELAAIAEKQLTFGDVVKHSKLALNKSEFRAFRQMDERELARALCVPAIELR
jgi:hypothetical protein